jgi:hypothetical protein
MKKTLLLALPLLLAATGAFAQAGRAARMQAELHKRFAAADANHDGKLTRDEAKGHMPRVYSGFDAIDTAKAGSVTLDQVQAHAKAQMGQRRRGGEAAAP